MGQRKLERSGAHIDPVAIADPLQGARLVDPFRLRLLIVERQRAVQVLRGEYAGVVRAAGCDLDVFFHAKRQKLRVSRLVQQRVATCEQDDVEVESLDKPGRHLPLVHPATDRLHDALIA